jgi:hypothetical protein
MFLYYFATFNSEIVRARNVCGAVAKYIRDFSGKPLKERDRVDRTIKIK